MDAINQGLWATLSADSQIENFVGAEALNKGVWHGKADDCTPLPLLRFRLVIPTYDYSFGGLSSERYVYQVTAFVESTEEMHGAQAATLLAGHARRVLTDAEFAIAGYELLLCRPYAGVPPESRKGDNGREQFSEGVLIEVVITPV